MIAVTRLDGERVFINERNIQWVESLPDTSVTFLGGARLLIREDVNTLMSLIAQGAPVGALEPTQAEANPVRSARDSGEQTPSEKQREA